MNNQRGDELGLMFESLSLVILNEGSTPTFPRGAGSIVDGTAASESLARHDNSWRVLESMFNYSDHHYIRYSLSHNQASFRARDTSVAPNIFRGWKTSGGIDSDAFEIGLLLDEWINRDTDQDVSDANLEAATLRSRVTAACNFALPPRRAPKAGRPPVH